MPGNGYVPLTKEQLEQLTGQSASEKQLIAAGKTYNLFERNVPQLKSLIDAIGEAMYNPEKWSPGGVVSGLKKYDTNVHGFTGTAAKDTEGDALLGPVYKNTMADYSLKLNIMKNEALPFLWYMKNMAVREGGSLSSAQADIATKLKANKTVQDSLPGLIAELDNIGVA